MPFYQRGLTGKVACPVFSKEAECLQDFQLKSNCRGTCRESRAGWLRDSLLPAARQIGDWGSTGRQEDAEEATGPHGNGMRVDVQPHAIGLGQRAHCVTLCTVARLDERMRVEWTTTALPFQPYPCVGLGQRAQGHRARHCTTGSNVEVWPHTHLPCP